MLQLQLNLCHFPFPSNQTPTPSTSKLGYPKTKTYYETNQAGLSLSRETFCAGRQGRSAQGSARKLSTTQGFCIQLICHLSIKAVKTNHFQNARASLVAQWLRILLPMQETWVRALVREDPTCRGATKLMRHNF